MIRRLDSWAVNIPRGMTRHVILCHVSPQADFISWAEFYTQITSHLPQIQILEGLDSWCDGLTPDEKPPAAPEADFAVHASVR
jgi:hypothetical protein